MITMLTPSAELYQGMATASAKAVTAAGKVMNNAQQGFLCCVTRVYNSLVSMKDAIAEGFHRLSDRMNTSAAPTPVERDINPLSANDTRKFCQEFKTKIPDSLDGMFRLSPANDFFKFINSLKTPDDLLTALKNNEIDNVGASSLVKLWMKQTMLAHKFSAEERKMLVAHKDNGTEVRKIFEGKFNKSEDKECENRDKFLSLLSVMNTYKESSLSNTNNNNRQHDPKVVAAVGIANTFEFDEKLLLGASASEIAMRNQERDEALTAFTALLDHCPPGVKPKPSIS